jgi:endonuclease/exonuclease/phosphatase family metal-dependent hydrolase
MNIHKGYGWYGKKSTLPLLANHLNELPLDLIFFQEILGKHAEFLVKDTWNFSYGKNVTHPENHYGNAILSKFPISFSENFDISTHRLEHRGLLYSVIDISSSKSLHLLCVHLGLFKKSRLKQLTFIVDHVKSHIPDDEPVILAGDFNDWTTNATKILIKELRLEEVFLKTKKSYAKTFPAWAPFLHLDRIYCRDLEVIQTNRLIDPSWKKLSDHIGLYVTLKLSRK